MTSKMEDSSSVIVFNLDDSFTDDVDVNFSVSEPKPASIATPTVTKIETKSIALDKSEEVKKECQQLLKAFGRTPVSSVSAPKQQHTLHPGLKIGTSTISLPLKSQDVLDISRDFSILSTHSSASDHQYVWVDGSKISINNNQFMNTIEIDLKNQVLADFGLSFDSNNFELTLLGARILQANSILSATQLHDVAENVPISISERICAYVYVQLASSYTGGEICVQSNANSGNSGSVNSSSNVTQFLPPPISTVTKFCLDKSTQPTSEWSTFVFSFLKNNIIQQAALTQGCLTRLEYGLCAKDKTSIFNPDQINVATGIQSLLKSIALTGFPSPTASTSETETVTVVENAKKSIDSIMRMGILLTNICNPHSGIKLIDQITGQSKALIEEFITANQSLPIDQRCSIKCAFIKISSTDQKPPTSATPRTSTSTSTGYSRAERDYSDADDDDDENSEDEDVDDDQYAMAYLYGSATGGVMRPSGSSYGYDVYGNRISSPSSRYTQTLVLDSNLISFSFTTWQDINNHIIPATHHYDNSQYTSSGTSAQFADPSFWSLDFASVIDSITSFERMKKDRTSTSSSSSSSSSLSPHSSSKNNSSSSSATKTPTAGDKRKRQEEDEDSDDVVFVGFSAPILPHTRENCPLHIFAIHGNSAKNSIKCDKCFCYVCDCIASECSDWLTHCLATTKGKLASYWKTLKQKLQANKVAGVSNIQSQQDSLINKKNIHLFTNDLKTKEEVYSFMKTIKESSTPICLPILTLWPASAEIAIVGITAALTGLRLSPTNTYCLDVIHAWERMIDNKLFLTSIDTDINAMITILATTAPTTITSPIVVETARLFMSKIYMKVYKANNSAANLTTTSTTTSTPPPRKIAYPSDCSYFVLFFTKFKFDAVCVEYFFNTWSQTTTNINNPFNSIASSTSSASVPTTTSTSAVTATAAVQPTGDIELANFLVKLASHAAQYNTTTTLPSTIMINTPTLLTPEQISRNDFIEKILSLALEFFEQDHASFNRISVYSTCFSLPGLLFKYKYEKLILRFLTLAAQHDIDGKTVLPFIESVKKNLPATTTSTTTSNSSRSSTSSDSSTAVEDKSIKNSYKSLFMIAASKVLFKDRETVTVEERFKKIEKHRIDSLIRGIFKYSEQNSFESKLQLELFVKDCEGLSFSYFTAVVSTLSQMAKMSTKATVYYHQLVHQFIKLFTALPKLPTELIKGHQTYDSGPQYANILFEKTVEIFLNYVGYTDKTILYNKTNKKPYNSLESDSFDESSSNSHNICMEATEINHMNCKMSEVGKQSRIALFTEFLVKMAKIDDVTIANMYRLINVTTYSSSPVAKLYPSTFQLFLSYEHLARVQKALNPPVTATATAPLPPVTATTSAIAGSSSSSSSSSSNVSSALTSIAAATAAAAAVTAAQATAAAAAAAAPQSWKMTSPLFASLPPTIVEFLNSNQKQQIRNHDRITAARQDAAVITSKIPANYQRLLQIYAHGAGKSSRVIINKVYASEAHYQYETKYKGLIQVQSSLDALLVTSAIKNQNHTAGITTELSSSSTTAAGITTGITTPKQCAFPSCTKTEIKFRCAKCKTAVYCSEVHYARHSIEHKKVCVSLYP